MIRAAVLVLLLGPAAVQDPAVDALLLRLDDDSIEARAAAVAELSGRGREAEAAVREALRTARDERRERLEEVLRRIAERARLDRVLPPPPRMTMEIRGSPLRAAIEEIGRRAGMDVDVSELPEDARVTVDLKNAAFWEAIEAVCRASGRVVVDVDGDEAKATPGRPSPVDAVVTSRYRADLTGVELTAEAYLGTADGYERSELEVGISWEKGSRPLRATARLRELRDADGRDLLEAMEDDEASSASVARDALVQRFLLASTLAPAPGSASLSRVRVEFELDYPLEYAEARFDVSERGSGVHDGPEGRVVLEQFDRREGTLMGTLTVLRKQGAIPPEVSGELLTLRDAAGREHRADVESMISTGESAAYRVRFATVPAAAAAKVLVLRIPKESHVERVVLDLKDVPLK